jgi:phosphatidate cytidylyltransferase
MSSCYEGKVKARCTLDEPEIAPLECQLEPEIDNSSGRRWPRRRQIAVQPGRTSATRRGAGRNLRAAIAVGSGLALAILSILAIWPSFFFLVIALAIGVGVWEIGIAVRNAGGNPPLLPLLAGGVITTLLTARYGAFGLAAGAFSTVAAAAVWAAFRGAGNVRRSVLIALLITAYIPFLLNFGTLLLRLADGQLWLVAMLLAVILSDTGGYIVGATVGRRPMAPRISPKKTWEGFFGSVAFASLGSLVSLSILLAVPIALSVAFGALIAVAAVAGDLVESKIKRHLEIKDMSRLLPGHGGVMDRLDSILFAVPLSYIFAAVAEAHLL